MILVFLLMLASPLSATLTQTPTGCSGHPCTHDHTCALAACTTAEWDEVCDGLNDASFQLGDTFTLEAGRTYPADSCEVTQRSGSGTAFIQSSLFDRLADALLTPEQVAAVPTIAATGSTPALSIPVHVNTVDGIVLRGVRFTMAAGNNITHQNGLLAIGPRPQENFTIDAGADTLAPPAVLAAWIPNGTQASCTDATAGLTGSTNYYVVNTTGTTIQLSLTEGGDPVDITGAGTTVCRFHWLPAWLPNNITIDRVMVTMDLPQDYGSSQVLGRGFVVGAQTLTVTKSWFEGVANGADSQNILFTEGGPYTIENNYFGGGATENVMTGGAGKSIQTVSGFGRYEGNIFAKAVKWWANFGWEANEWYEVGALRRPVDLSAVYMMAQNSGTSGGSEPTWPALGQTVVDNEITWERVNFSPSTKNFFEYKDGGPSQIIRNGFYWTWTGSQSDGIVIKRSNLSSDGQELAAPRNGFVDVTGTTVTWVSGDTLPHGFYVSPYDSITIDGTPYTVDLAASGWQTTGGSDLSLELTTSPGPFVNVPFVFGNQNDNFQAANMDNITVAYNRMRHAPHFGLWRDSGNVQCCASGTQIVGNLGTDLGTPWGIVGTTLVLNLQGMDQDNYHISHNTFDRTNLPASGQIGLAALWGDQPELVNTIWPGRLLGISTAEGMAALLKFACANVACEANQFDKNIILGGQLTTYTLGTTWNLCPDNNTCVSPDYSTLFEDRANDNWRILSTHAAYQNGTDGLSVGANPDLVPDIRSHRVEVGDDKAIIHIEVTPGAKDYPCVARVSTARDLRKLLTDQDVTQGATYAGAYADNQDGSPAGAEREIPLGVRSPLTASTLYHYGLYCGGAQLDVPWNDLIYSFTTSATLAGTGTISVSGTPTAVGTADRVIRWGTSYDRATDAIQSPTLGTEVACTTSAACTANFTTNKGDLVYYRTLDRDAGDSILASGPVRMAVVR